MPKHHTDAIRLLHATKPRWSLGNAAWTVLVCAALAGGQSTPAQAEKASCDTRSGALGVSRVVEIDTTGGPLLGNMQYRDIDFLKPGEVVLTFDDGPLRRHSLPVLNALERHCTKATFFMVGRMAVSDPDMVQEIHRRGHTVGTHTWSHKNLARQSQKSATREIELGISAISAALGQPVAPFFRFPYLAATKRMIGHLQDRDTATFSIDIDSRDFRTRSGSVMADRIMRDLKRKGKGILLFHDIQKSTARGIDQLLNRLKRGGYKIVHLVPKAPTTTLASFDDQGMLELIKRKKAASSRPLAKRSVVWPIALGNLPPAEPLRALPKPIRRKGPLGPKNAIPPIRKPASIGERNTTSIKADLRPAVAPPSSVETSAPEPKAQRVSRPTKTSSAAKKTETSDWRDDIFNY